MTQHPHAELSAYIDGALAPTAHAAVEEHLVTCALCRAHLAELRATVSLMHALPDPVPSRRLVPHLAGAPAWLAPLRTLMTLASGLEVRLSSVIRLCELRQARRIGTMHPPHDRARGGRSEDD